MHDYIRLEHEPLSCRDHVIVNWCLGNTCNYACSYCPNDLHNGTQPWADYTTVRDFCDRVIAHYRERKLYFEFTGGEVTLWRHFTELAGYLKSQDIAIGLISNGSRTRRYWEDHKHLFTHVCLSFHPEFAEASHFLDVIALLAPVATVHVNVMMAPTRFDECYRLAEQIVPIDNVSLALQPLLIDLGSELYPYTPEQQDKIARQSQLTKPAKYTRKLAVFRARMAKVDAAGHRTAMLPHVLINNGENNWLGWNCYSGVEQIVVDMDGHVYRGWCKVGGSLGQIGDPAIQFPRAPIRCTKTHCHCNFDIMSTKEKP
jgi:organic radical activating enzyme